MLEIAVYLNRAIESVPTEIYWIIIALSVIGVTIIFYTQETKIIHKIVRLALIDWIFLVFFSSTVFRDLMDERGINLLPFWSYFDYADNSYLKEMAAINALNIIMFLPIGILLKLGFSGITRKMVLMIGLVISLTIEVSQYVFCKGLCEVDDVLHNVAGCMMGYGVARMLELVMLAIKNA